jgi:sugar lactone lactonase YvrE
MRSKSPVSPLFSTLVVASAFVSSVAQADDPPPAPELVASYDPTALEVPESIATDPQGNIYVSLALTGEISRIDASGAVDTLATLPIAFPLEPCFGFVGGQTALTYTPWGLYVNVNSCDADARGIWWVSTSTGATEKVASLPPEVFANGIAHRSGYLYVSDSFSGRIFRAPAWGGEATVWVDDPLLDPVPSPLGPIAANGVQHYDDELYVSNSTTGQIIAFEVLPDQSAGASRVHATLDDPCDDFAFDRYGTIYCGTNPVNTIVAIYPDGETEVVLSGDDFLDGPSSTVFGRASDRKVLYISNASFPFYPNHGSPSVVALELDVAGYPFR